MEPKIGCVSLVYLNGGILGIRCSKGRGLILPGGKWQEGETFAETVARELYEETGYKAISQELFFQGMAPDGYYVYLFKTRVSKTPDEIESSEGEALIVTWDDLLKSRYAAFLDLVRTKILRELH